MYISILPINNSITRNNRKINMEKYITWCKEVGLDIKPHQQKGYSWCIERENAEKPRGGIISDEMGLGKTILMLACIITNHKSRTLIVVPPALLEQWSDCIMKFLKHPVFIYHGSTVKNTTLEELKQKPIVLTTYGMVSTRKKIGYKSLLWGSSIKWDRLICDEAHHLRNPKTGVCKGAFEILSDICWMVTGTPIQNKLGDIRVLCARIGVIIKGEKQLREFVKKYVLRRTKKGVGINIPDHHRKTIMVGWESEIEKTLAASIHCMLPTFGVSTENVNEIIDWLDYQSPLPLFVRARQVCINHHLLGSCVENLREDGIIPEDFILRRIRTTSKISAVIRKVKSEPKELKKIIFCYYRGEIDELKRRLINANYSVAVMDGRSKKSEKIAACDPEEAPDILIAQIQSASEGLNLQHFSQIYFTSPHWNPAVEDQAIARAHRIGQEREVQTFHFEMMPFDKEGMTIDNYCMEVQKRKRDLMKMVESNQ